MTSSELSELVLLLENKLPITGKYPRIGNFVSLFVSVFDKTPDNIKVCPSFTLTPPVSNLLILNVLMIPQFGIDIVSVTEANSGLKLKVT